MNKVQKLRNYFNGLPTLQDKIRAILLINELKDVQGYFDADERAEFEKICYEFYYPTKIEDGVEKPDVDTYREHIGALQEMSVEALDYSADAARRFYAEALKDRGEYVVEKETFNANGDKEVEVEDRNWIMAVMKSNQLPRFDTVMKIISFVNGMNMDTDSSNKYEDALLKMNDFKEFLQNEAREAALEKKIPNTDDFIKQYIKELRDGGIANTFNAFLFQKALEKKNPDKISDILSISGMQYEAKNGQKCGYDHNQVETVRNYGVKEDLAHFGKPWEEDIKQKNGIYIKQISKVGPADNLTPDELISRMGQISQLYAHMQRNMKSIFRDSDLYKQMTAAMRKVSELYGDGNAENLKKGNNIARCRIAMREVLAAAGNYIDARSTNRSFTKGKNRFEAAIAAAAIVNEDVASRIIKRVNEIRRTQDNTQLIDLRTVSEHLRLPEFNKPKVREQLNELKSKNKAPLSQEEYLHLKDTALSHSSRVFLVDKAIGNAGNNIEEFAKRAGLDGMKARNRAASMILGYIQWKHPEYADRTASELLNKDDLSNAAGEFEKFLEENAIYRKVDGPLFSDEKVRTSMKNLAEYQAAFVNRIKNRRVPDYSDQKVRSACFEEMSDLMYQMIDFNQNMHYLPHINLDHGSGKAFFFDEYPGGMEGYHKDEDILKGYGILLQNALNIEDSTKPVYQRTIGKIITDRFAEEIKGRKPEEYFASEEGRLFCSKVGAFTALLQNMAGEWSEDKQKACREYVNGKAPLPDFIRDTIENNKQSLQKISEETKQTEDKSRQEIIQNYLARKGEGPVQKTSFSDLQEEKKEEKKQGNSNEHRRNEIKHQPEEEEIFQEGFKRKKIK